MFQIEINLVFLQRIYAEMRNMILGKRYYYVLIVRLEMDLVQLPSHLWDGLQCRIPIGFCQMILRLWLKPRIP